jgi:hypothetical protein
LDDLLLAAMERAELHSGRERPGVPLLSIKEHLGLAHNSWTSRRLRPGMDRLEAAGLVKRSRRHGVVVWILMSDGHDRLEAVRAGRGLDALPESPQHRVWREARTAAAERISELRNDLRYALLGATSVLEADPQPTPSDTWFEFGERLAHACARLGSATYCCHEWAEPDDSYADLDSPGHRGRRNTRPWA